ncbi:MAG: nitronate monooxygenase [Chloroflexales bacterium]|nr:nitronate monooxygenase [Chloroflexales bacterium]
MHFLEQVKLIQGGMGVYVSNWRLAKAVAMARPGATVGTVSGTALDVVYVRLLQLGDPGGHARRALAAFDNAFGTGIGQTIYDRYFIDGGKAPDARFKNTPMQIIRAQAPLMNGSSSAPIEAPLHLPEDVIELLIATGFVEVWLAKEGHRGNIFINFLNKIELPLMYVLYGAMLADVDGVVVGAGNPDGLPARCSQLANHVAVTKQLAVLYQEAGEIFTLTFDPQQLYNGAFTKKPLKRPAFLAIVALDGLVQALAASASEAPDGFIIEHHTAGGHNANPVGPRTMDDRGQPRYSEQDDPDLAAIRSVGLPFWLAGGYGSHAKLQEALAAGATGVQVGSTFALAEESGLRPDYRSAILKELSNGTDDATLVRTTMFSPTGFAFKVVQLKDTLADQQVFENRRRVCDIGLLQQVGVSKPNADGMRTIFQRCAAAPVAGYIHKRGLQRSTENRRCLCNGLLSCVGLGQVKQLHGVRMEEPAVVTLGDHLDGVRRLSRQGQTHYWATDVVTDILG